MCSLCFWVDLWAIRAFTATPVFREWEPFLSTKDAGSAPSSNRRRLNRRRNSQRFDCISGHIWANDISPSFGLHRLRSHRWSSGCSAIMITVWHWRLRGTINNPVSSVERNFDLLVASRSDRITTVPDQLNVHIPCCREVRGFPTITMHSPSTQHPDVGKTACLVDTN